MKRLFVPAAVALVCLTNVGALTLGSLNRSRITTDVTLTERELRLVSLRSTVTLLRLQWMQPSPVYFRDAFVSRAGFVLPPSVPTPQLNEYARRQLSRQVYVALEYDGPAWTQYRDTVLRHDAPGAPAPMAPSTPEQLEQQRRAREQSIAGHSRLFAIDVDRDADRLRARHPDMSHVLITQARASLMSLYDKGPLLVVSVNQLTPDQISVPRPWSVTLRRSIGVQVSTYGESLYAPPRYAVHLRYGRFHEPWVDRVDQVR